MNIVLDYDVTRSDVYSAGLRHSRISPLKWVRLVMGAILVLLALPELLAATEVIPGRGSATVAIFFVLLAILIQYTPRLDAYFLVRRFFSNPVLGKSIHAEMTDESLNSTSEAGTGRLGWKTITKWTESAEVFLLMVYKGYYVPIPKRAFQSEAQIEEFRQFLTSRMGKAA